MTDRELFDALGGLFAYDMGCVDSGIKDELLRKQVIAHLKAMDEQAFRVTTSRYVRDEMLGEAALEQGYGIEDVARFIDWLSDRMDCDL